MSQRVRIGRLDEFPEGIPRRLEPEGEPIAIVRQGDRLYAIADRCPHRGASLSRGTLAEGTVSCPLHGWTFRLEDGRCLNDPGAAATRYEVTESQGELYLDLTPLGAQAGADGSDGISRYLIRYGVMGWVGRFGSITPIECARGDYVVVQTRRGLEMGEVLFAPGEGIPVENPARPSGEVQRRATAEDLECWRQRTVPPELMSAAIERVRDGGLALDIIDAELLFDGKSAVLYYLGRRTAELAAVIEELERQFECHIHFDPVLEADEPVAGGCGGGGCGSGGCSGSGGCGSSLATPACATGSAAAPTNGCGTGHHH